MERHVGHHNGNSNRNSSVPAYGLAIDNYIHDIHAAVGDTEALLEALTQLREKLLRTHDIRRRRGEQEEDSSSVECSSFNPNTWDKFDDSMSIGTELALRLMQTVIVVGRVTEAVLVSTILACGPTFVTPWIAAMQSLRLLKTSALGNEIYDDASHNRAKAGEPERLLLRTSPTAFSTTLQVIDEILFGSGSCNVETSNGKTKDFLVSRMVQLVESDVDAVRSGGGMEQRRNTTNTEANDDLWNDTSLWWATEVIERLPRLVANASAAQKVPLPIHWTRRRFLSRLLQWVISTSPQATSTPQHRWRGALLQTLLIQPPGITTTYWVLRNLYESSVTRNPAVDANKKNGGTIGFQWYNCIEPSWKWSPRQVAMVANALLWHYVEETWKTGSQSDGALSSEVQERNGVAGLDSTQGWHTQSICRLLLFSFHGTTNTAGQKKSLHVLHDQLTQIIVFSPSTNPQASLRADHSHAPTPRGRTNTSSDDDFERENLEKNKLVAKALAKAFCECSKKMDRDDGNSLATRPGLGTRGTVENYESDSDTEDERDDAIRKDRYPCLMRQLKRVAELWSTVHFVRNTDRLIQTRASAFLREGLKLSWMGPRTAEASQNIPNAAAEEIVTHPMVSRILQGVTYRLEITAISSVRLDGMRVAETMAQCIGQEICFDELTEEREKDRKYQATQVDSYHTNNEEKPSSSAVPPAASLDSALVTRRKDRKLRNRVGIDPDADFDSDEDDVETVNPTHDLADDDDSVWEEDDMLNAMRIEDDEEDLRETPKPTFLRDCLRLMRTPESNEDAASCHQAALEELPKLVWSRPLDLSDVALELALEVLHMEDKFAINGFVSFTRAALVALLSQEPLRVGNGLVEEVFGQQCSLLTRLKIFSVMAEAATELSGRKQLVEANRMKLTGNSSEITSDTNKVFGKRRLIDERNNIVGENESCTDIVETVKSRILSKTRRWGRSRREWEDTEVKRIEPTTTNQFARGIAPTWFYGLLGHFVQRRDEAYLWTGQVGTQFLAQFVWMLAFIVEETGPHAAANGSGQVMARDLLQFAWSIRSAEPPEVRLAALGAIATSISHVSVGELFSLWRHDELGAHEMSHGLGELAKNDPHAPCRELAGSIQIHLQKVT